jgi:toxin-antitoxin system PIN domain toxin
VLVVDTNILVYAANNASPFHKRCSKWLEDQLARPDAWYVTWPIIYEFLRVSTHRRTLEKPFSASSAWSFVRALLASPGLAVLLPTERHSGVAEQVLAEFPHLVGNIFHDAHTAILMREHGIRQICTRDTDFHQFKFLNVIDPLQD